MPNLFDPLNAGELRLRNRVVMAPLTRSRAGEDGVPTDLHVEYYTQRASAGLMITEGAFPAFTNRAFLGQPGITNDEQQAAWARVADSVHDQGGLLVMQIMHAGHVTHPGLTRGAQPEAPGATATDKAYLRTYDGKQATVPARPLTAEDLVRVKGEFVSAARRAVDAGMDGVELHSANGYLLHEFLSPGTNRRDDDYGGSPQARAKFVVEVIRAVAEEIGAGRTAVRISPEHNIQGVPEVDHGDVTATYDALIDGVNDLGLAYLSVLHAAVDGDLVTHLRHRFNGAFLLNSGFGANTALEEAEHIVDEGVADAVVVGRPIIANPDLVIRWRDGLPENTPDPATFYTPGPEGYIDYPFASVAQPARA
ncbi:alkene reductase [Kocuria coralli]|uniref:Alkene reductase n=1 Tax=Kocuria coralli TaxID=1461025 RepID=A0A5J5KYN8_9MICC|nr:alkene reductase [Kocuria coralli]KAA9394867.1 alkene reductase [Kocuria coralli]